MKKRYLMIRYGLAAIVLLFLLIWLSQQNAADNSLQRSVFVNQQLVAHDPPTWLERDSQPLQEDRNTSRLHRLPSHNTERSASSSSDTSRNNRSEDSQIHIKRNRIRNRFEEKNGRYASVREERPGSLPVADLNEHISRSPIIDDEMEVGKHRYIDVEDVRNSSVRYTGDVKRRPKFSSDVTAKNVNQHAYETTPVVVNTVVNNRQTRPSKQQLTVNDSSVISQHTDLQNIDNQNHLVNFRLVSPSTKPSTSVSQRRAQSSDDDADASLILARQLSLRNFVKSSEERPSLPSNDRGVGSTISEVISATSHHQRNRYQTLLDNTATNSSVSNHFASSGSRQEIDELKRFAAAPTLPDYDLPLLKASGLAAGRVAPSSSQRPVGTSTTVSTLISNTTVSGEGGVDEEVLADTDDVMSGAVVLGEVNPSKMYAVFSTTSENREALNFIFLLPLTALAWKRVGFDSVVIVVGPVDLWNSDELFHYVLSTLRQLSAVVVFLEPRPEKSVMISQVLVQVFFCIDLPV